MGKLIGTKFLEERPGVLSMARLAAFLQTIAGFLVQLGSIIVAIKGNEHSAGIVAALSAGSAACFAGAWAALKERHKPSDDVTVTVPPPLAVGGTTVSTTGTVVVEPSGQ